MYPTFAYCGTSKCFCMPQSIVIGAGAVWVLVLAHQYSVHRGRQSNRNTLGIQEATSGCRIKHLKWSALPPSPDLLVYKKKGRIHEETENVELRVVRWADVEEGLCRGEEQLNLQ